MAVVIGPVEKKASDGRLLEYKYDALIEHAVWQYWRNAGSGPTVGDIVKVVPQASRQTVYDAVHRMTDEGVFVYDEYYMKIVPAQLAPVIKRMATMKYKEVYGE